MVNELLFHQLMSAATVVMPAVTSCSTVALSMGSTGLPQADRIWLVRASSRTAVRVMVPAEMVGAV